ncbi:MAG: hypothetical protein OXM56_09330 [Gammaproteobacteria bacterium]|nr:hypothetical protein [Gammaproteobacteria bacterium]
MRYAVIDRSGWLGDAARRDIIATDVATLLDALAGTAPADPVLAESLAARGTFEARAVDLIHTLSVESGRLRAPVTLHERFAAWWMEHPDTVRAAAPEVSFTRFVEVYPARPLGRLARLVADGSLDGYFIVPDDSVATGEAPRFVGSRAAGSGIEAWYGEVTEALVARQRVLEANEGA